MKSLQNISYANNIGYYKLKNLFQANEVLAKKKVTVNVKSSGVTGINLRYVRGRYSKEGMSEQKAVTMDALIASFHSQRQGELQQHIQETIHSKQDTISTKISILKNFSSLSKHNYSHAVLSEETVKGLVVDTVQ